MQKDLEVVYMGKGTILTGIDQINDFYERLRYEKVALLTTGVSLNRWMVPTLQCANDRLHLTALFGAEYGIMGELLPGQRFESYTDVWTGLPVFSLYRYGASHLSKEMLAAFDYMLVDLPLTGTKYCSYISAVHRLLRELGRAGKKMIILDRPNPLGGQIIDGPIMRIQERENEDDFPLPSRFGMTLGELALMMNDKDELGCDLEVIKVKNWTREVQQPDSDRPWIVPNVNLPHYESCLLSVGLELLRGTNLSFGEGTPLPFEMVGATYLDAIQLSAAMNKKNYAGLLFHPTYFTPAVGRHQGCSCQGVRIHVTDRRKVEPLRLAFDLLNEIRRVSGEDFRFIKDQNENYPIDHLFGSNRLRRQPEEFMDILADIKKQNRAFAEEREPYLLYGYREDEEKSAEESE